MEDYKVYFVQYYYGADSSYDKYGEWVVAKNEKEILNSLMYKHGCSEDLICIGHICVSIPLSVFIEETHGLIDNSLSLDEIFDKYYKED